MLESPSKEQVLIQELLHKLDAERLKNARLESELSQYKEPAKMKKDLESRIKEQDIIIKKKDRTIDQLNQRIAWLNRKFWGQSTERHASEDPAQLSFKFAELKLTPEEEAAYKKAEAEAEAFRQQRKAASDKRQEKNRPTRKPLPENLREIASLRLSHPDMSLTELGKLTHPPIGKSGVNHRLRRISEIAESLHSTDRNT